MAGINCISIAEEMSDPEAQNPELARELDDLAKHCLLYTSDAADDLLCVDLGGRRIIKKTTIKNDNS